MPGAPCQAVPPVRLLSRAAASFDMRNLRLDVRDIGCMLGMIDTVR